MQITAWVPGNKLDDMAPGDLFRVVGRGPKDLNGGASVILERIEEADAEHAGG